MAQHGGQSRRVVDDGDGRAGGQFAGVRLNGRARTGASDGIRRVTVIRATTLAIAAALTLAGCTATAAPAPSAPGTPGVVHPAGPTTTPSPTLSPIAPPQRPAAMDRDDAEGAIAAATYFISLYPYVYASGDLLTWNAMSDPACIFCASVAGNVGEMVTLNHSSDGPIITIESAQNGPVAAESGSFAIEVRAEQGPSVERDKTGAVVDRVEQTKSLVLVAAMAHTNGSWIVREVQVDEAAATHG